MYFNKILILHRVYRKNCAALVASGIDNIEFSDFLHKTDIYQIQILHAKSKHKINNTYLQEHTKIKKKFE